MKIVYIHQYFKTPSEGGAIRSYHLARKLVVDGHSVEMVTSRNADKYEMVNIDGITVHYLPIHYSNSYGFIRRVVAFIIFIHQAFHLISKFHNVDFVYATSTPLSVGILALRLKRKLGVPYIFEVRDLWPDAPIEMGMIKNRLIQQRLFKLEKKIYDQAMAVIALSPPVKKIIESRTHIPVYLIPNFSDNDFFKSGNIDLKLKDDLQLEGSMVIIYSGAIGKVNRLESLIDLALVCQEKNMPAKFLIIGKGAMMDHLKRIVLVNQLSNIVFIPHKNKFELLPFLNLAHAAYISFEAPSILETSSPNKFFDALAAGKLIIYNKKGWIKELIESHQCGFYADPDHPENAYEKLRGFFENPIKLAEYQTNAVKLSYHYSKNMMTTYFSEIIKLTTVHLNH